MGGDPYGENGGDGRQRFRREHAFDLSTRLGGPAAPAPSLVHAGDATRGTGQNGNCPLMPFHILSLLHEKVHQFLTPKLQIFRGFRLKLSKEGYRNSFVLRYLEEALAETSAQLRLNGLGKQFILKGLRFPFDARYEITVAALKTEVKGILIGPITVGSMIYNVYFGASTPDE
jgi:hypothetical protein